MKRWTGIVAMAVALAMAALMTAGAAEPAAEWNDTLALAADEQGWQPLFKDDLSNATQPKGGWVFANGELSPSGEGKGAPKKGDAEKKPTRGDIWTTEKYGDFILDLEFKCEDKTNSGVFVRTADTVQWLHTGIEIQILQDPTKTDKNSCGSVYDCLAPSKQLVKAPGEWNHYTIVCKANRILVVLNGEPVTDMNLDQWTEAHKNPDGSKNKFNTAYKDMAREGFVGLQYHNHPVWFRNLRIKPLK